MTDVANLPPGRWCVTCRHCTNTTFLGSLLCAASGERNLVTGEMMGAICYDMRLGGRANLCGEEGKLWEPKG